MDLDNVTTTPFREIPAEHTWQLPVIYVIGILGIIGNGTVFIVYVTNPKTLEKLSSLYIFHQTIIDFCSSVIFLAYRTHVYYQQRGYLEGSSLVEVVTCKIWYSGYVLWTMLLTSNLNLTLLSLERHFAVCHSVFHRNHYTVKRVKISMGLIWIIGVSYEVNILVVHDINEYGFCTAQWSNSVVQSIMGVVTFLVEYLIPLSFMIYSYTTIIFQLKSLSLSYIKRKRQTVATTDDSNVRPRSKSQCLSTTTELETTRKPRSRSFGASLAVADTRSLSTATTGLGASSALPSTTGRTSHQSFTSTLTPIQQNPTDVKDSGDEDLPPRRIRSPTLLMFNKAKYNATRTLCFVFITFVICWTPAEVEYLIDNFRTENQNCYVNCESIVDAVVTNILLLNMIVNPVIYAISLKEFQENFKKTFLSAKKSCSSLTPCKLRASRRTSFTPDPRHGGHDNGLCQSEHPSNDHPNVTVLQHKIIQYKETYHS